VKRLILIASLVLGLGLVAAPVATPAAPGDAKGPACGNITDGDGSYTGTLDGAGTVDFIIQLQAPACSFVSYSLVVTDTTGNPIPAASPSQDAVCSVGGSGGCVHFTYPIASSPAKVCIYATTAIQGHIVDSAPNASATDCTGPTSSIVASLNGGVGAGGNFN
jgi:hypothetical protein